MFGKFFVEFKIEKRDHNYSFIKSWLCFEKSIFEIILILPTGLYT